MGPWVIRHSEVRRCLWIVLPTPAPTPFPTRMIAVPTRPATGHSRKSWPPGCPGEGSCGAAPGTSSGRSRPLLGFTPVPTSSADALTVPDGYVAQVLIPWGTPIRSSGPAWHKDASNTAAEQAQQIGMHHDGMHFFPLGHGRVGNRRGLLVLNHEYTDRTILYTDGDAVITQKKVDKALAAHGVSVVAIELVGDSWQRVDSRFNRRITGTTPMRFSGPVRAGHPALQADNPPMGTLNNCSHGVTPWGTYLACEENWNGYFGTEDPSWEPTPEQARYGVVAAGFGYRWHLVDPRFDVAVNPNELNRFGWMTEIDPLKPNATPVKRTALGRIKHESATFTEARGRIVVYSGDDQDGDYLYKFVSSASWRAGLGRRAAPNPPGGRRSRGHTAGPARMGGRPPQQRRVRHPHQRHQRAHAGQPPRPQPLRTHHPLAGATRRQHRHHLLLGHLRARR
jgi:secreted PhoX family phosphatase